ncbi:MAG: hypothetical protein M3Y28_00940, partial [Armatimonadota bacterium]|nr:hypothetical protein [Armatimonadota bacterium]
MLELSQIVTEISAMGVEAKCRKDRAATQLQTALRQARLDDEAWAEALAKKSGKKPNWAIAHGNAQAPGHVFALPY